MSVTQAPSSEFPEYFILNPTIAKLCEMAFFTKLLMAMFMEIAMEAQNINHKVAKASQYFPPGQDQYRR